MGLALWTTVVMVRRVVPTMPVALTVKVVERVPNARRDAGTGCKAILDALNGIAWRDDRQLVCHPPAIVDTDTAVAEVVVWFGDAHGSGVMRAWTLLVDAHLRQRLVD